MKTMKSYGKMTALKALLVGVLLSSAFAGKAFAVYCKDCINQCCALFGCSTGTSQCSSSCVGDGCLIPTSVVKFDPTATLSSNGRQLSLTGPITCTAGLRIEEVRVTVTQGLLGVVAEGRTRGICTGVDQEFEVKAEVTGASAFQPGPATACGLATIADNGQIKDATQWCREVTLETP